MKCSPRAWLFWALWSLTACKGEDRSPEFSSVRAEIDPYIPNVAQMSWDTSESVSGRVSVLNEEGTVLRSTSWSGETGDSHQVGVVGLEADTLVFLRAEVRDSEGRVFTAEPVELEIAPLPIGFPEVEVSGDDGVTDGLILTHILSSSQNMVVIFDRSGTPVWYTIPEREDRILSVSLSEDGRSIWYAQHPTNYVDTEGVVTQMAIDGSFYRTYDIERVHSGAVPLPDGGFGYLKKMNEDTDDGVLLWDEIWEVDSEGIERSVFSLRDHFEVTHFCHHWEMYDIDDIDGQVYIDWTHANSLLLSEDGASWYVMVRHFDGFLKIDRETGTLDWILGGPYSDFAPIGFGTGLSHPHFSTVTEGSALIFDNGSHYAPPTSRLVQFDFDQDSREVSMAMEIRAPDGAFVDQLGDATWTPEGHVLGSWTTLGLIEEYESDLEIRWSLALELGFYTGRVTWMETLDPR